MSRHPTIPAHERHPDVIVARAGLLVLMLGIGIALTPHTGSHSAAAAQHRPVSITQPNATQTPSPRPTAGMRPALATAIAQGRRKAHLRWLFTVYLPKQRRTKELAGSHWQIPPLPTARANSAAPGAAIADSIYRAFSAFAEPYATEEIALHIVQECQVHACDAAIVAGLFLHEDGNINNEPGHFNNLLYHDRNPGNIECYAPGRGCYDGYQQFATYAAGIDGFMELWDYYHLTLHITDFYGFVSTYCPGGVQGNGPPSQYQGDVINKANAINNGW